MPTKFITKREMREMMDRCSNHDFPVLGCKQCEWYMPKKEPEMKEVWCEHYRLTDKNWYEREARVGSGVFNVIVHYQDMFCAICTAPRPIKKSKLEVVINVMKLWMNNCSSSAMNMDNFAQAVIDDIDKWERENA